MSSASTSRRPSTPSCCASTRSPRSRRWTAASPCCPCGPARRRAAATTTQRHGTTSLFAALDIATGQVIGKCYRPPPGGRVPQVPRRDRGRRPRDLDVHLVMDNYATHKTPLIRNWLAKRPRWHVHLTPTSSSWLNQVERFFALITDKKIRRGIYRSVAALTGRHHFLHRTSQRRSKAVPMDQIRRRHPRFHRTLLPLQCSGQA